MSSETIRRILQSSGKGVVLMDGGMGSMVEDRGIDVKTAIWGSYCFVGDEAQEINDQIHNEYVDAGAQILMANTHNVRRNRCDEFLKHFDAKLLPNTVRDLAGADRLAAFHRWLHDQAMASARRAIPAGKEIGVASCLGSVEPLGPYATETRITTEEACQRLEPELLVRKTANPDLIIFETLTTRSEIAGIQRLGDRQDLGDFAVGLTCGADGATLAGVSMQQAVEILTHVKPMVYFIQCTRFDYVRTALEQLVPALPTDTLCGVYANDGRVWKDRRWHGERITPKQYAEHATLWNRIGAKVIGGCCGTTPAHIAALKETFSD